MSPDEVAELLEYSDVFAKYLQKKVNEIQAQLGSCKLIGKESDAYIAIKTIKGIIESLSSTEKAYKDFLKEKK